MGPFILFCFATMTFFKVGILGSKDTQQKIKANINFYNCDIPLNCNEQTHLTSQNSRTSTCVVAP